MIRRLLVPLLGSGLLLAASAGSAFAKCEESVDPRPTFCSEVIASLNGSAGGLVTGVPQTIVVTVSQGEQPFEAIGVVLSFLSREDGSRIEVPATATGQAGVWRAEVNLPDGGIWNTYAQVVTNAGAAYRIFVEPVLVSAPEAPPVTTPVATTPVTPAPPIRPIALLLTGIAAAGLVGGLLIRERSRRRTAGATAASSAASAAAPDRP